MNTQSNYKGVLLALPVLALALGLRAQILTVNVINGDAAVTASALDGLVNNTTNDPFNACNQPAPVAGMMGADYALVCNASANLEGTLPLPHETHCHTGARAFVRGDQSPVITVNWKNTVANYARSEDYWASGQAELTLNTSIGLDNVAAGSTHTVYYEYSAFIGASTDHETDGLLVLEEDPMIVNTTLTLNTLDLLPAPHNFANPQPGGGGTSGWNQVKNQFGSLQVTAGTDFVLAIASDITSDILPLSKPYIGPFGIDQSDGMFHGRIRFSLIPFSDLDADLPGSEHMLFSLDIGSDCEYGDPFQDGDEQFDPGDVYEQNSSSASIQKVMDDQYVFGVDPIPSAPGAQIPYHSIPMDLFGPDVFDLDALETSNYNLDLYTAEIPFPFTVTPNACLPPPEFFALSYDDDTAENWSDAMFSLPVESASPTGNTYGETQKWDEVNSAISIGTVNPGVFQMPLLNEGLLHTTLQPNPTFWEEDDDCDALAMDYRNGPDSFCPFIYFSSDREGRYFDPVTGVMLDPGAIYQVTGPGAIREVMSPSMIGILPGTDIDAFTFGAQSSDDVLTYTFAIYFSVDEDDPMTPEDESGGLNPRVIYYSILNGAAWPFIGQPFFDDIDALTLTSQLYAMGPPVQPCPGDLNGDLQIGTGDLLVFIPNFGCMSNCGPSDLDGDGEVGTSDLLILLSLFGTACP